MVLRYPQAFDMTYCENLDLSISGMREQLSILIRNNALFNESHAFDWKLTERSYRNIVSHMFQYDQYNRTGGYARKPGESEECWLDRASVGLRISESTATDEKICVWISKDIATMLLRFYLIRAVKNLLQIPAMIDYHDKLRFANPSRDAISVINDYQTGFSILQTAYESLEDKNVQQLALAHDCIVVFTTESSPKGSDLQLYGAGHYRTYIKNIPIDAHKAAGQVSSAQWKTFISHIRKYGTIPRGIEYQPFESIHIVNSIAGAMLAKFTNPELKTTSTSVVIDEVISMNQRELGRSTDNDLVKLFMVNIKLLEKLKDMSFRESSESLSDVRDRSTTPSRRGWQSLHWSGVIKNYVRALEGIQVQIVNGGERS